MGMVKNDRVEALRTIYYTIQNQFEKIISTVFDNPNQAYRYADAGRYYSASLKRKYDTSKQGSSNTPTEVKTSMELLKNFEGASCSTGTNSENKKLISFVNACEIE